MTRRCDREAKAKLFKCVRFLWFVADDEINIDLGKIGRKIKGWFSSEKAEAGMPKERLPIDFSKIKSYFKGLFRGEGTSEDVAVDFSKIKREEETICI